MMSDAVARTAGDSMRVEVGRSAYGTREPRLQVAPLVRGQREATIRATLYRLAAEVELLTDGCAFRRGEGWAITVDAPNRCIRLEVVREDEATILRGTEVLEAAIVAHRRALGAR